jgi:hypothetical protein
MRRRSYWLALTQEAGTPRPQQAYLFSNLGHAYALSGRDALALLRAGTGLPARSLECTGLAAPGTGARAPGAVRARCRHAAPGAEACRSTICGAIRPRCAARSGAPSAPVQALAPVQEAPAMAHRCPGDGMARSRRVPAAWCACCRAGARGSCDACCRRGAPAPGNPERQRRARHGRRPGAQPAGAAVQVVRLAMTHRSKVAARASNTGPRRNRRRAPAGTPPGSQVQVVAADCPSSELRSILGARPWGSGRAAPLSAAVALARQAPARLG